LGPRRCLEESFSIKRELGEERCLAVVLREFASLAAFAWRGGEGGHTVCRACRIRPPCYPAGSAGGPQPVLAPPVVGV